VTFAARHNPYTPEPQPRSAPQVDPRHGNATSVEWTRRSLAGLRGANSVTYYVTHGPGGILGTALEAAFDQAQTLARMA
jgi:hypothetical protein